jgi:hypothetical protein
MNAIDKGDYWELPLGGEPVARCCVDLAFVLEFGTHSRTFLLRMDDFTLDGPTGSVEHSMTHRDDLGPSLTLIGKTVECARAHKSGTLEIQFTDSTIMRVEPDKDYEAWQLAAETSGLLVVCGPGGALSIWQPR